MTYHIASGLCVLATVPVLAGLWLTLGVGFSHLGQCAPHVTRVASFTPTLKGDAVIVASTDRLRLLDYPTARLGGYTVCSDSNAQVQHGDDGFQHHLDAVSQVPLSLRVKL